ncbi:alpha/beta hydrolase family protein [Otariodibacter oris]|uniref:Uncharacterized protein n=1 Tax=Otariodibacter oris TaxID=1032623 RepID=A0A420XHI4_9PAST|nr:lipase family protein [Otariodibacter oris]QGM81256.1 hypothetical protein A6A10_07465 [Otariodibacter oris]RKR72819.1 hypothetical protein DES31_0986 [Otariodibacter oris]
MDKDALERGHLLTSEFVATIDKNNINHYFPEREMMEGNIDDLPKYDIDLYRITYRSVYENSPVVLSGLVVVPKKEGKLDHIQYHHGTLYPYAKDEGWGNLDAPSLYDGHAPKMPMIFYETRLNANYLGSYGYLVSLPDYAGYGVSQDLEHPYCINSELAEESIDMILATREFAKSKNLAMNDGVFLSGWSEGAAVAVATQKLVEEKYSNIVKILANAPMSGYLNTENIKTILSQVPHINEDVGGTLDLLAWLYYSYNKFSENPITLSAIFKFPISNGLDVLTKKPSNIPALVFKILDKQSLQHLADQIDKNNLAVGWKPVSPLIIYHGTADKTVPYENNPEVALNNYEKYGGNTKLVKFEDHDHYSLGVLQLKNMMDEFEKIKRSYKSS